MGSDRLSAYQITDFMEAYRVISNERIANEIYEDDAERKIPDVYNEFWIGVKAYDELIACYRVHQISAVVWQGHAHVLPQYRRKFSRDATHIALDWCVENVPNLKKIITVIPATFANVSSHLEFLGFEKEGTIKDSYLRLGALVDQYIYTITVSRIKEIKWEPQR